VWGGSLRASLWLQKLRGRRYWQPFGLQALKLGAAKLVGAPLADLVEIVSPTFGGLAFSPKDIGPQLSRTDLLLSQGLSRWRNWSIRRTGNRDVVVIGGSYCKRMEACDENGEL
jgi:hypothetical protein